MNDQPRWSGVGGCDEMNVIFMIEKTHGAWEVGLILLEGLVEQHPKNFWS